MENNNQISDIVLTVFSFLSTKIKIIIIVVVISIFIVVIVPVTAIMSMPVTSDNQLEKRNNEEKSLSTDTLLTINEVVNQENMMKYKNATFPMPFETWNPTKDVVTSRFSKNRTITVNGVIQSRAHTGIDIVCISKASPKICAVASGKVVVAKAGTTGYGNYVVIEHLSDEGKRFYTLYGHMVNGSISVAEGSEVKKGQVLGIMGSTGNSTGPHLHFEVRLDDNTSSSAVNPYRYLFGEDSDEV